MGFQVSLNVSQAGMPISSEIKEGHLSSLNINESFEIGTKSPVTQRSTKVSKLFKSEYDPIIERILHSTIQNACRATLTNCLKGLPLSVLRAIDSEGYKIMVIPEDESAPLPFNVEEFDVEQFKRDLPEIISSYKRAHSEKPYEIDENGNKVYFGRMLGLSGKTWDKPMSLGSIAGLHGAKTEDQVKEYVELILLANSEIFADFSCPECIEIPAGKEVLVPDFQYYRGKKIHCGCVNSPYEVITANMRGVAGYVLCGKIADTDSPDKLILMWDSSLSGDDGLAKWYVIHEVGHALWDTLKEEDREFFDQWSSRVSGLYESRMKSGENDQFITTYSKENEREYYAEGFAAYFTDPDEERKPLDPSSVLQFAEERLKVTRKTLNKKDRKLSRLIRSAVKRSRNLEGNNFMK